MKNLAGLHFFGSLEVMAVQGGYPLQEHSTSWYWGFLVWLNKWQNGSYVTSKKKSGAVSIHATGFALLLWGAIIRTRGGGHRERKHSTMQFIYVYNDRKKDYLIGVGKNLGTITTAKHKVHLLSHSLTPLQKGISHQYSLHQISWSSELLGCEAGSYTSA